MSGRSRTPDHRIRPPEASLLLTVSATSSRLPERIDRRRWPAHVTVLGNVHLGAVPLDLAERAFTDAVADRSGFDVVLGERAWFGPDHDVPVLLAEHEEFHRLHGLLVSGFDAIGARPSAPDHRGDGYRPHLTTAAVGGAETGATFRVRWLSLVALDGSAACPLDEERLG